MSTTQRTFASSPRRRVGYWAAVAALEALFAASSMALIAFGPLSRSTIPLGWLAGAAILMLAYLGISLLTMPFLLSSGSCREGRPGLAVALTTVPFLAGFALLLALLQFRPSLANVVWYALSPIQPFPLLAVAITLLLVFLVKLLAAQLAPSASYLARTRSIAISADFAILIAFLLIGVLQASIYITPIGNAFLRFWAVADSLANGTAWTAYPVTLTEPGPVAAGSPPYVYDLALFPLMLWGSFGLLGHNSAAAHLPAAVFNALFPLTLYLLIRQATGSRVTGILCAGLASLFPYLRLYVLNLPDPDPLLLTSLCSAGYLYLRALAAPDRWGRWLVAGLAAGILSLARPEGLLYAGCLSLAALAHRPGVKQICLYAVTQLLFVGPMATLWLANFGFLWPQNYNRTLSPEFPMRNYTILEGNGSLHFYAQGLGLNESWAAGLFCLFVLAVLTGAARMALRDRRLLAMAIPGIGNTVTIFFANPVIPNTYHYADFFRHASFGLPFLVATAAYGFYHFYRFLAGMRRLRLFAYLLPLLLAVAVVREGDILANPTLTHRPPQSWPAPTQVLPTYTHLSLQAILENPMPLPEMTYYGQNGVTVAQPNFMAWPEDALAFFKPFDISFESAARPFAYGSVVLFLTALSFALLAAARRDEPRETTLAAERDEAK